jgi:hypothetical protein
MQGWHQAAQKSSKTGTFDFNTSLSKFAAFTAKQELILFSFRFFVETGPG